VALEALAAIFGLKHQTEPWKLYEYAGSFKKIKRKTLRQRHGNETFIFV
jgi:hypothetical protein